MPKEPSKVWVDSIKAHLQVLSTTCGHVPGGERLEVQDLNEILDLMSECKNKFLFICELYDFKLPSKE